MASESLATLRNSYTTGITKQITFRTNQLKAIIRLLEENTNDIVSAIDKDLHRHKSETVMSDMNVVRNEALNAIYNLSTWIEPEKPAKSLANIMDEVLIHPEPYGVILIIAPWNYPFQLAFSPLVGAIAAGNCAIIKPSEIAPNSSKLIANLIEKYLDNDCYKVIEGGVHETTELLSLRFDYIFYTGSTSIGKIVSAAAAKTLTPVTLELGGKSPVYLDDSVDVDIAAARIMWGKCLNSGQTCIAPDYILCSKQVESKFIEAARKVLCEFYTDKLKQCPDYARIVNDSHFERIVKMMEGAKIALGGDIDAAERFIHPTIIIDAKRTDPIMQDEIFGPVLPIVTINSPMEAINFINEGEKPLALYIFSSKKNDVDLIVRNTSSGGVCVNDTIMHFACESLPFGGVGYSGIGAYHGKNSFDTFSHRKGMLFKSMSKFGEKLQAPRYPPYNEQKIKFLGKIIKPRPPLPTKHLWFFITYGLGVLTTLTVKYACRYFDHHGHK